MILIESRSWRKEENKGKACDCCQYLDRWKDKDCYIWVPSIDYNEYKFWHPVISKIEKERRKDVSRSHKGEQALIIERSVF